MFKKIKINYTKGKLRQFRIFNLPIIQYEKTKDKKLNIVFPLFRKPKKSRPVFYIKINSKNWRYSIFCMHHWISIANEMNSDFYIICDDINIEYKLLQEIPFTTSNIKFLKSNRTVFKKDIRKLCSERWVNAGYSHLTTYLHAYKNGINEFWNIDGDDTSFFEEPQIIAKALLNVEKITREKNIHALSLDMHRSSFYGLHWTFGVTFTQMNIDIKKLIKNLKNDNWKEAYYKYVLNTEIPDSNVDLFFTYLNDKNKIKLGTFNIDNLYFMHWGICNLLEFFKMLQVEKDGILYYPISKAIDINNANIPVYSDIININANIDIERSRTFMQKAMFHYKEHLKSLHTRWQNPEIRRLYELLK